jgi:hypothetical protein
MLFFSAPDMLGHLRNSKISCESYVPQMVFKTVLIGRAAAHAGLPDLWEDLAGDCQHTRSTAVHNHCA